MSLRGRPCRVCQHPSRGEIEKAVVAGTPRPKVAEAFGVPEYTLKRHMALHAKAAISRYMDKLAEPVVEQVKRLVARAEKTLDAVEGSGDDVKGKQLAGMYRELRSALELLGKMTGEYQTASVRKLLSDCGAKDEAELIAWSEDRRALTDMTLEDFFRDGCAMVRFCIEQKPELAEAAYREAFPRLLPKSEAVEVEAVHESVAEEVEG